MNNVQYGDDRLQSIRLLFHVLTMLLLEGLPANFKDIQIVNVYAAPGVEGDDWKAHLNDQSQAWIITPLYYSSEGLRIIRKASGGGTWDARTRLLKKHGDAFWYERKYNLVETTNKQQATNERTGHREYTMIEYSPGDDKPDHALCRIIVDKNCAHDSQPSSSQQRKSMEIDHADANKGDKGETSLSHEPMQQGYYCLPVLERNLRELRQHFSDAVILEVFSRIMGEKIPAARPKEYSTKAPGCTPRKRRHCPDTDTMEANTSTQWQEQSKVGMLGPNAETDEPEFVHSPSNMNQNDGEQTKPLSYNSGCKQMFESNSYREKPTNFCHDTNRSSSEFGEQSSYHGNCNEKIAEYSTNTSNSATIEPSIVDPSTYKDQLEDQQVPLWNIPCDARLSDLYLEENGGWWDQYQEFESSAHVQEPNKLSHNFNANSTEPTENSNHLPSYNQNKIAPGPSTSNYATTSVECPKSYLHTEPNFSVGLNHDLEHGITSDDLPCD